MKVQTICIIVLFGVVCFFQVSLLHGDHTDDARDHCELTEEESFERLKQEPWEGTWHTHDDSPHDGVTGRHFHRTHRDFGEGSCNVHETVGFPDHNPGDIEINTDDTDEDDPDGDNPAHTPTRRRPYPNEIIKEEDLITEVDDPPGVDRLPEGLLQGLPQTTDDPSPPNQSSAPQETGDTQTTGVPPSPNQQPPIETGQLSRPGAVASQTPIRVTEYMVRDWSGQGGLPQWIEVHNPSPETVDMKGYIFQYATRKFANSPYKVYTLRLKAHSIPPGGTVIFATHMTRHFSGIKAEQVYNLDIANVLKSGWVLSDARGREIHRIGRDAFNALRDPVAPPHQGYKRVSHEVYPSETPETEYSYGGGIGTPGFYKEPAPAAPSASRRKKIMLWGELKGR